MNDADISLPHLRRLIGLKVRYQGETCMVVEVLETPCALVLEALDSTMQADMHGRAWEYGRAHHTVPVLNEDRTGPSDDWLELDLLD